jgi:hypothetical protein
MKKYIFSICLILLFINIAKGEPVQITMPDLNASPGSSIQIAVTVGDLTGLNVYSYYFSLEFDETILNPIDIALSGTLSQGFSASIDTTTDGAVTVLSYSTNPLSGSGVLVNLDFDVVGSEGNSTPLNFTEFLFNEGTPEAEYSEPAAYINIVSPYDVNCDGTITMADIELLMLNWGVSTDFDTDGNGFVDMRDIQNVIANLE